MRDDRNLELVWADDAFDHRTNALKPNARGTVWSLKPVYCGASVSVHNRQYAISTAGWLGLTDAQIAAVENHLEAMGLTKRKGSGI